MLFLLEDLRRLFKNKHVVIMGDSVQRCVYKDIVLAVQDERLLTSDELKKKGEKSCCNDKLLYRSDMNNGRGFCEVREYQSQDGFFLVQYYFLTRCYSDRMEAILQEFKVEPPDVIIMNSCMWDISRYGPNGEDEYYANMNKLCTRLREVLPPTSMFLWTTTMPIASQIASGFLLENIRFLSETLRVAVLEANYYVAQIVTAYGFDVLDMHYYMRALINHREKDGCHWDSFANRHITDMISVFLHDAWGIPLPAFTAEQIKKTNLKLDLRHFNYDGHPTFVTSSKRRLERLAEGETTGGGNENEENDREDEGIEDGLLENGIDEMGADENNGLDNGIEDELLGSEFGDENMTP